MKRPAAWRSWCDEAVHRIEADFARSADTHLLRVTVPGVPDCPLYFKDESVHPTGSLKHRLARSLFLYGLCNGLIGPRTTVVEASSGGGTVTVKMNGRKQVLAVRMDPEAVKAGDVEMLQDLVTAAVNASSQKVDKAVQSTVGGMLGGMGLPGL